MEKKKYLFCVVFIVVALCTLSALAFDPMGTPTAGLKHFQLTEKYPNWSDSPPPPPPPEGQFRFGVEYMWSRMDVKATNVSPDPLGSTTINNIQMDKIYANIGLGLTDDWEIFVRLGTSDFRPDEGDNFNNLGSLIGNSTYGFSIGGGTKITFAKSADGKLKWGALGQISWSDVDFKTQKFSVDASTASFSTTADIIEAQIAVGPTYNLMEGVSVYGGPFVDFIAGNADIDTSVNGVPVGTITTDLKQKDWFGGYIGTQVDLSKNMAVNAEFLYTGRSYGVGGALNFKF